MVFGVVEGVEERNNRGEAYYRQSRNYIGVQKGRRGGGAEGKTDEKKYVDEKVADVKNGEEHELCDPPDHDSGFKMLKAFD